MNDSGEVVPLPERSAVARIDDDPGPSPRTAPDLLREALLSLPHLLVLLYRLLRDPAVPARRKLVAGAIAAYVASPIDLIPDFVPVAGQVDDLLLAAFALDHLIKGTPDEVVAAHWPGTEDALDLISGIVTWAAELVPAPLRRLIAR